MDDHVVDRRRASVARGSSKTPLGARIASSSSGRRQSSMGEAGTSNPSGPPTCSALGLEGLDGCVLAQGLGAQHFEQSLGKQSTDPCDQPHPRRAEGPQQVGGSLRDERGGRAHGRHLDEEVRRPEGDHLGLVDDPTGESLRRSRARMWVSPSRRRTATTSRSGRSASARPVISGQPSTAIGSSCGKGSSDESRVAVRSAVRRRLASRAASAGSAAPTTRAQPPERSTRGMVREQATTDRQQLRLVVREVGEAVGRLDHEVGVVTTGSGEGAQAFEGQHVAATWVRGAPWGGPAPALRRCCA